MTAHNKGKTMQRAGRQPNRTRFDQVIVALVGILTFIDMTFIEESRLLEKWQFDEVPFSLFALAIALVWFAYRRVQELKVEISERERAEDKLRRAHDELREAYETLERAQASAIVAEKLAALGRLTAGVSHEMLNPLQVITLNISMLTEDPSTPPDVLGQLREIEDHAKRITKIIKDLLYFARHRPPERQPVDCNEAVRRTVDLMKHDLKLNDITVEANFAKALPAVSADQDQLRQVVLNLLTNARDAMPDGGRLLLRTNTVQVNGERWVELRVKDTGSGIAPEHMEKLFDPFFTTKAEGEGTGLGLSICKGIVEAHGGAIWAENTSGGGADFIVQLEIWGE